MFWRTIKKEENPKRNKIRGKGRRWSERGERERRSRRKERRCHQDRRTINRYWTEICSFSSSSSSFSTAKTRRERRQSTDTHCHREEWRIIGCEKKDSETKPFLSPQRWATIDWAETQFIIVRSLSMTPFQSHFRRENTLIGVESFPSLSLFSSLTPIRTIASNYTQLNIFFEFVIEKDSICSVDPTRARRERANSSRGDGRGIARKAKYLKESQQSWLCQWTNERRVRERDLRFEMKQTNTNSIDILHDWSWQNWKGQRSKKNLSFFFFCSSSLRLCLSHCQRSSARISLINLD